MSARLLLLCPGQGGQHRSMFDVARGHPRAAALIERSGYADFAPADLFSNQVAQPAIVCATLAMWEALRDDVQRPALVAGYSIGELSAYGVAGAIDATTAIELATVRAALMDEAISAGAQAMAAIGGLAVTTLRSLAQAAGFHVAIVNGPDTCIVGGFERDLAHLAQTITQAGGRIERLPVAVASHTPLMAPAVPRFAAALATASFGTPSVPVLSGIGATRVDKRETAINQLSRQLAETIEWRDCMDAAAEAGITVALELGPGTALSRMLRAVRPEIACRSVAEFRGLEGITSWLASQRE
jgi:[acyl-carrier-protein] S-malonyltransferase